jgi:hypothetical protein
MNPSIETIPTAARGLHVTQDLPGDQSVQRNDLKEVHKLDSSKAMVTLPGFGVTISETAQALFGIIAPTHELFVRGKVVVTLSKNASGTLIIDPLSSSAARTKLEAFASFFAPRAGRDGEMVLKPSVIPEELAKALLASHIAAQELPSITGIVGCPILAERDGKLVTLRKGFDRTSGLLVTSGLEVEEVPVPEAVRAIRELVEDFSFQSEGDRSRAIASILTPAIKMGGLITGPVPIDVAEATESQSGKTYRQKLICAVYNEIPALVPLKKGGCGSVDESLAERLINGRPFVQLDNYRGRLDSPMLEALITSTMEFPCRVPHCREILVDPGRFFLMISSNGADMTIDLANRSSIIRILKRRGVTFRPWLDTVKERQGFYLGAVFAVVREWYAQGKPKNAEDRHDFREWVQALDWILQHIFNCAPIMEGHLDLQTRVANPTLGFLRRICQAAEKDSRLGQALLTADILELAEGHDIEIPGCPPSAQGNHDRLRKLIGSKLSPLFRDSNRVLLDHYAVIRDEALIARTDGSGSTYLAKRYTVKASHKDNTSALTPAANENHPF